MLHTTYRCFTKLSDASVKGIHTLSANNASAFMASPMQKFASPARSINVGLLASNSISASTTPSRSMSPARSYSNSTTISETEKTRKRLLWQSIERGLRENDILLGSWAKQNLATLPENLLKQYDALLQQPDPDIFNWIAGKVEPPPEFNNEILRILKEHVKAYGDTVRQK